MPITALVRGESVFINLKSYLSASSLTMKVGSLKLNSLLSIIPSCLMIGFSILGVVLLQSSTISKQDLDKTLSDYQKVETEESQKLTLLAKTPRLGFDNVLADWLYLQFIQYFGDTEAREKTGYGLVPDYFLLISEDDPHFVEALNLLEVGNSLFAAQPEVSIELLEKALGKIQPKFISRIPPYYLWRAVGNNELLFIGNTEAAKEAYQKSIEWANHYKDDDSRRIIDISERSINFLNKNPDSTAARIGAWVSILANNSDPKTAKRVMEEIEKLGGTISTNSDGSLRISIPQNSD